MSLEQSNDCRAQGDTPELYFCRDMKGYGWCFRKGRHLNIGLGREGSHCLTDQPDHFCDFLKDRGIIPKSIPDRFHGHAYLLYGHAVRNQIDDGMLLVGDAAGLAYPQSGEGIGPAVESGLMAAATILEAQGDYCCQRLLPYSSRLLTRFGVAPASSSFGQTSMSRFFVKVLLKNKWLTRHAGLDRWFLHSHQLAI